MARVITVAAAQLGPIARSESRGLVVKRLLDLLGQAQGRGCDLVVFPELALTTFFPRWWMEDQAEIDAFFEREMPGPETRPLFDEAARLGMAFCLGYAELIQEAGALRRYNTSILVDRGGRLVGKYRKVHLPGHAEHEPSRPFQHLEKRYFDVGDLGFPVWRALGGVLGMCICNDRRWPETYRVMGLQGVEMILLGYNTPAHNPPAPEQDALGPFHNHLVMQAGAYQNATWVVGVAKCGREEGCDLIGQSAIIAPSGEIVAQAATLGDELISARCDLDLTRSYKDTIFNFARHRRPEHYRLIVDRVGAEPPEERR
ncbi:MAG TPA: N-carbamoyl-D-amino-acid hydrolase [Candidatus Eisenbacteria bacterium]|jgi:predicted amidohydrolase|nr:N-carbamoyl-D-amino-acid hydrolase [Candidatus Eisenbacteria bacterium]